MLFPTVQGMKAMAEPGPPALLRLLLCDSGLGNPSHVHQSDRAQRESWPWAPWPGVPPFGAGGVVTEAVACDPGLCALVSHGGRRNPVPCLLSVIRTPEFIQAGTAGGEWGPGFM